MAKEIWEKIYEAFLFPFHDYFSLEALAGHVGW